MKNLSHIVVALLSILVLASGTPDDAKSEKNEAVEKSGIEFFEGTWQEALDASKQTGKPIFLDAYASWCGPCKILKARVFTDERVGQFYNENFINVAKDMEKGEGRQLSRTYRVTAYPSLFFVKDDGSVIKRAVGYHNPDQLIGLGETALAVNEIEG